MTETHRIVNVRMEGNEHGQLAADTIYADLVDHTGKVVIAATLHHVLQRIRALRLHVEGVTIEKEWKRGAWCSTVRWR